MKKFSFLFLVIYVSGFSQNVNKIDIGGIIKEKGSGQKIEYACLQLLETTQGNIAYGAVTDSSGSFFIPGVKCQNYKLVVSRIGYKTYKQLLTVSPTKSPFSLSVQLILDSVYLHETVIKGTATGTKTLVDKIVFVPDSTVLKDAMTGLDVIRKAPDVTVNKSTNEVKVLGNPNVLILIDGMENNRDLRSIDSKDIERVEIITNPSSKYDSDVATVLNVILRKDRKKGLKILTTLDFFTQKKHYDGNISVDYSISKFRIFGSVNLRENLITTSNFRDERETESEGSIFRYINYSGNLHNYKFTGELFKYGLDFYPWSRTLINFTGSYGKYRNDINENLQNIYLMDDSTLYTAHTYYNSSGTNTLQNYTLYFKQKFGKKDDDNEITCNTNIYNMQKASSLIQQTGFYYPTDTLSANRTTLSHYSLSSVNTKLDYTFPLYKLFNIGVGGQYYERNIRNLFTVNNITQNFNYYDVRKAFYFTSVFRYKKISAQVGVRCENYRIHYDTVKFGQLNLMPTLSVMLNFHKKGTIKVTYKNSLTYPDYYNLSPFIYYSNDSLTVSSGSPNLKPEKTNSFELNYSIRRKSKFVSTSLLLKRIDNLIGETTALNGHTLIERTANVGLETKYGVYLYFHLPLTSWLETSANFRGYYDAFQNRIYNGFEAGTELDCDIFLPLNLDLTIEASAQGTTRQYNGYDFQSPLIDEITLARNFFKNQLAVSCSLINFILPDNWKENSWDMNYHSYSEGRNQSRCILLRLTFFLKHGKEPKNTNRELNMENDEK